MSWPQTSWLKRVKVRVVARISRAAERIRQLSSADSRLIRRRLMNTIFTQTLRFIGGVYTRKLIFVAVEEGK